jgi:hypothetical protein
VFAVFDECVRNPTKGVLDHLLVSEQFFLLPSPGKPHAGTCFSTVSYTSLQSEKRSLYSVVIVLKADRHSGVCRALRHNIDAAYVRRSSGQPVRLAGTKTA